MTKVLLVGCGHMGSALLSSWLDLKHFSFVVVDPFNFKILKKKFNKKNIEITKEISNKNKIKTFDIIIFAIKPQIANKVINEYRDYKFKNNSLIASIIAGKTIRFFNKNIKNATQIVRIMPNMPAMIGESVSCLVSNKKLTKQNKNKINELFMQVGLIIWLKNETEIDKATAISGSGPGYIFTLINSFEKAAQKIGFSKKISRDLIFYTFLGSLKLMQVTNKEPFELAKSIAVKGGTTEAGIKILNKSNMTNIIYKTFLAAYKKANKLGKK